MIFSDYINGTAGEKEKEFLCSFGEELAKWMNDNKVFHAGVKGWTIMGIPKYEWNDVWNMFLKRKK